MRRQRAGRIGRSGGAMAVVSAMAVCVWTAVNVEASSPLVEPLGGTVRTAERPAPQHVSVQRIDGVDYVELQLVARVFHATKYWRAELEKMVLKVAGHRVRLTVGSPYVFVDDRGVNLLSPVRWHDGQIIVPVRLATEVLDELTGDDARWDPLRRALTVGTGEPNVLDLSFDVRQNGTLVELLLSERLDARLEYPRSGRIAVVIEDGVLEENMLEGFPGTGLLDSVEARQDPGSSVILLHLGLLGGSAELLARSSPPRLIVAVSEGPGDDIPLPGFERPARERRSRRVNVVVIDPGHGGSDTGTTNADGMAEKDITLQIAQRLRDRLHDLDDRMTVILTREDDRFLSNEQRAQIANESDADVFVSVHGNGWFHGGMRGYSVGTFGGSAAHPPSEFARWGEPDPDVTQETEQLAEAVLDAMSGTVRLPARGVRSANYAVLAGTTMPALFVECGFLTNPEDAHELASDDFQEELAVAIARGIGEFAAGGEGMQ